ncbi:MAG TPA: 3-dehydroquinate synthase [Nitrospiria bacterium]
MRNIVLIGFMGTGKSEVGRYLAHELGLSFEDTDDQVQRLARMSIPAIFKTYGEDHFRKLEKKVVSDLSKKESQIIATGGGVVKDPENISALRRNGILFTLEADAETIRRRTAASDRPLLKEKTSLDSIGRLIREREPLYRVSDHRLNTSHRDPSEVGRMIKEVVAGRDSFKVNLGDRTYPIDIKPEGLSLIGERMTGLGVRGKIGMVTNPKIERLYGKPVLKSLSRNGFKVSKIVIPDGERHKTLRTVSRIYDRLLKDGFDRSSTLLALGGGVIGDICGFAAATFMRGIEFIQVPTTLVAQVDASIGGKTGVDHSLGKNLIGAFHQPRLVYIDPEVLKTLPKREFISGLAEVVKYGVIWDEAFFSYLHDNMDKIRKFEPSPLSYAIRRSCGIKAEVVQRDEREGDLRKILNYGHTLGHAIETYNKYRGYLHGEAVSIGMAFASKLSVSMGLLKKTESERQVALLEKCGLPVTLPKLKPSDIFKIMGMDKKAASGKVHFVLAERIGKVTVTPVEKEMIMKNLTSRTVKTKRSSSSAKRSGKSGKAASRSKTRRTE